AVVPVDPEGVDGPADVDAAGGADRDRRVGRRGMIAPAGWRGVIAETLGCPDPGFFFSGRTGSGSPGRSGGAAGASDEGLQPGAQGGGDGEFEVVGPAAVDGDPIGEDEGLLAFGQGV